MKGKIIPKVLIFSNLSLIPEIMHRNRRYIIINTNENTLWVIKHAKHAPNQSFVTKPPE